MLNELRKTRLKKLETLAKSGSNPYPLSSKRTHRIEDVLRDFRKFHAKKKKLFW